MIWYLLIGYVIISQVVVMGIMTMTYLGAECPQVEQMKQQVGGRRILAISFYFLSSFLLAPLTFPFMVYLWRHVSAQLLTERRYWVSVQKSFTDVCLDPLHRNNIDEKLWNYFEEQSTAPVALGYRSLGDVWIKDFEPFNSKGRFFLNPEGTLIAEIGLTLDVYYCELMSFLEDGSVVASAVCDPHPTEDMVSHGFHTAFWPGLEMDELIGKHLLFVAAVSEQTETPIRRIGENQWRDYVMYSNQRHGQILFELGKKDVGPDDCQFPLPLQNDQCHPSTDASSQQENLDSVT